jgi:uncharacterized membrane protein YdbT with pleckstrin-like domain
MPEETIWKGTASHWKNFNSYALTIASIPLCAALHHWLKPQVGLWIFGITGLLSLWALWRWLLIRSTHYNLSSERLVTTSGVLTKVTDTMELYRVRDMQIVQPPIHRLLGLQNIHVYTNDASTAELFLDYIPASLELGDKLRKSVEVCRDAKRVRTMDVLNEPGGDGHHTA